MAVSRSPRAAALLGAALALGLLAGGLWADDEDPAAEEPAATGLESLPVPRSEETASLALEITTRLNEKHYSLVQTDVPGFTASFKAERDGVPIGRLGVAWRREGDRLTTRLTEHDADEISSRIEWLGGSIFRDALAVEWDGEDRHAVRSGDWVVMDATAAESALDREQTRHIDVIRQDLSAWWHVLSFRSGCEVKAECAYVASGDELYLRTCRLVRRHPEEENTDATFTCTYTRRPGRPFLKRVVIDDRHGGNRTSWKLELVKAEFSVPAQHDPRSEVARLAEEVISRIRRRHYSFWSEEMAGFEAVYRVRAAERDAGSLRHTWEKATGRLQVTFESTMSEADAREYERVNGRTFKAWIEADSTIWIWEAVLLSFGRMRGASARAKKVDDGHVLVQEDTTGIGALVAMITRVGPDDGVLSVERRWRSGQCETRKYSQQEADGRLLKKRMVTTVKDEDGGRWQRTTTFTYLHQDGFVFPRRVVVRSDAATGLHRQDVVTIEFEKVEFR